VDIGAPAVEPLIATFVTSSKLTRQDVAKALGEIGDNRAVKQLITALSDADYSVRYAAAEALGKIGDELAVAPLISTFSNREFQWSSGGIDYDHHVVVLALSKIGVPAISQLVTALDHKDFNIRNGATFALSKIGPPAVEPLIAVLQSKDNGYEICQTAAIILGRIGDTRAIEPLKQSIGITGMYSIQSLGNFGSLAVEFLITILIQDTEILNRQVAAEELGKIKDKRAMGPLIAALADSNSAVCKAAAESLIKMGWRMEDITASQVVELLISIYNSYPEGINSGTLAEEEVQKIGQVIDKAGGMKLMLAVHQRFAESSGQHARNLEMRWSGIGEWKG
jgi:HEAT repeat protein